VAALHVARNRHHFIPRPFFTIAGCRVCGLIFIAPRPDDAAVARFYAAGGHGSDEWTASKDTPEETERWRAGKIGKARVLVKTIMSTFPEARGTAFDFGCGVGHLLDALKEAGWRTVGLEPNPIGEVTAAHHEMVSEVPRTPTYDLVAARHVLEHVTRPAGILRSLHAATKPDGVIFVGVPSVDLLPVHGDLHYACNPIHMNGFTERAVTNVLRVTGWEVTRTETRNDSKLLAFARWVPAPLAPLPEALAPAISALRAYGRQLTPEGKFLKTA
jgi:SAM-dependent methyltransferase